MQSLFSFACNTNMEVVVGTYEELILGYKLQLSNNVYSLETSFTDHSHTGCVRTVAISGNGILATGSSDESIKLFNLRKRKEVGSLIHHDGYVSCLAFYGNSHMFSCSADGTIGIWKTGKWECEKTLRGHKDAVNYISIHPSGKMALSVSQNKMCTWNLLTGKCAYKTHLKSVADIVKWTPDGQSYLVVSSNVISVYSVETASVEQSIKLDFRVNCVEFINEDIMVVGGEGGKVQLYNLKDKEDVFDFNTETTRVKGLGICKCGDEEGSFWLTTGSSDGWIKIWKLKETKGKWSSSLETSTDIKFRIVSMSVSSEANTKEPKGQKSKTESKKQTKTTKLKKIAESKEKSSSDKSEESDNDSDGSFIELDSDIDEEKLMELYSKGLLKQADESEEELGDSDDAEDDSESNEEEESVQVKTTKNTKRKSQQSKGNKAVDKEAKEKNITNKKRARSKSERGEGVNMKKSKNGPGVEDTNSVDGKKKKKGGKIKPKKQKQKNKQKKNKTKKKKIYF